ncbi:MAG: S-layer homology domain-containing protein [Bacillota bacterium]|nr:S-layer homology domain-containing protein [Bacillota bacterium]MDD3850546.1 S-layer homology domain-containing protein [Bacillota bacterium]MDD4707349.1 S-layer homology domain-containing protein [Bacillota bacterium]
MKRLVALTLVIVLVLGVSVTGYAAPDWKQGGGLPPGIQKQITLAMFTNLKDLDMVPWAKNAMEKMSVKGLIKGYGDNTFKPNSSVSQLEAVVMALRVLGWEEDARSSKYANNLLSKYKGGRLDPWAYGYVNVAYEKGILDEVDIMYFNPNSAAKRWEVAKYFVRALDKEDIAEDHMRDKLDFKDYTAIPVGAVGYIYVMNDLGLMVGNANGTFNPNGAVSRAEMAVLLERIDGKVDRDTDGNEIYGRVVEIDAKNYELKLNVDGSQKWYEGIDRIAVYKDGEYYDFDELKRGDYVEILLNSSGKVIFIEFKDENEDKIISDFRGEVRDVDARNREITIKSGTAVFTFSVKSDADIRLNGKDADLKDIKAGDSVRLKVDDRNRVIKLSAEGDHDIDEKEEVEGTIYKLRDDQIRVKVGNNYYTFDIEDDTKVYIDEKKAEAEDLMADMPVVVRFQGDTALRIMAESLETELEGVITGLSAKDDTITVKVGSRTRTLSVNKNTAVRVNGKAAGFKELAVGMKVTVRYRAGLALRINAEDAVAEVEGVITSVNTSREYITVEVGRRAYTYSVADADIYVEGDSADIEDLVVGMTVELELLYDSTVNEVDAWLEEVEGIVQTSLDDDDEEINLWVYDTIVTYELDEDVEVELDDDDGDLEDIERGDRVVLEFEDGLVVLIKVK